MTHLARHIRTLLVALTATALSAGLAFGAQPPAASRGLSTAAVHSGTVGPSAGSDEELLAEDDETAEDDEDTEEEGDGGDNCTTDPTELSEDELALLSHGQIVCWAAHQTEWPSEFKNHGAWVSSWAKQNNGAGAAAAKQGNGKALGKSKQDD